MAEASRIKALAGRWRLPATAPAALGCLLDALVSDPLAPTAVRSPQRAIDDHLADALVALELDPVRQASRVVDIGSGAGLPGLPLAIALPSAEFVLLESSSRKCSFVAGVIGRCRASNASVVHARAENWREGIEAFDLALVRAVASIPVLLEYAAPLLRVGGFVVAWRGRRDSAEEEAGDRAAAELGLGAGTVVKVSPFPDARDRHLHLWSKISPTPERFPRRPGMAAKRPLGGARSPV